MGHGLRWQAGRPRIGKSGDRVGSRTCAQTLARGTQGADAVALVVQVSQWVAGIAHASGSSSSSMAVHYRCPLRACARGTSPITIPHSKPATCP